VSQCLGKISELVAIASDFFGEESKVVCMAKQLLEMQSCFFDLAGARQTLDKPE
jgi:hypothetical protein